MSAAAAFDQVAAQYDALWTNSAVGRAQRDQVWRHIDLLFQAGDRVLDLGCGTGEDAAHLKDRGVIVKATDPSPAMLAIARLRVGDQAILAGDWQSAAPASFDGVLSDFGALNCVADLDSAARDIARLVRPGGRLALCVIGRFCLQESLYYCARLKFAKAFRRWRGSAPSSLGITIHYPAVRDLAAAFAPAFTLRRIVGIGLFVPPSYARMPGLPTRWCSVLDRGFASLPILRACADHRLLIFVRK